MIIELSFLAAFGAMICWGIGDFFIQRGTREAGDIESLAFIGIIGTIMLLPFVLQELPLLFFPENVFLLVLIGIVTLVAAMLDFEALKQGKLSVIEVIFEIELPVTIILGLFFFSETLSTMQTVLILLVLAGIGLISLKSLSKEHYLKKFEKGIFLAVAGAIVMGLLNFLTAAGSRQVSPIMAIWVPYLVFTIVCVFFIWRREGFQKFFSNAKKFKFTVLGMGIFDTTAWLLFAIAVLKNELAITIAITESYPVIAMVLGNMVNKEKIRFHQFAGAAMALIGGIALAMIA